ncbi:uncharacterized protein LOC111292787 [Durio zibethinus]|uniref:Uncharacterized protein LOC111292787 n=1 Tax=Durio zibethinus TaxID=66656 RepID=A0A6P5YLY6_DURZI|nr:uncharacterized protein LOC111292787 [Durio zibethinus]
MIFITPKKAKMNQAIRSVGAQPSAIFSSTLQSSLGRKSSSISFRAVTSSSRRPENPQSMDQKLENNPKEKTGDVMSHSFGEGYATRSDEEGFGGTYGGNQSESEIQMDKEIHENHPAYDKSQGSEVKEKEKARHQTHASS